MGLFKTQREFEKTFKGAFSNSTQAKTLARGKKKAKTSAARKRLWKSTKSLFKAVAPKKYSASQSILKRLSK